MVRSLTVDGHLHQNNSIPDASIHRGILVTSAILSRNLATGEYPVDKESQFELCFAHFVKVIEAAGADLQEVVRIKLFLSDFDDRLLMNRHWPRLYPDPDHRSARQAMKSALPKDAACR